MKQPLPPLFTKAVACRAEVLTFRVSRHPAHDLSESLQLGEAGTEGQP